MTAADDETHERIAYALDFTSLALLDAAEVCEAAASGDLPSRLILAQQVTLALAGMFRAIPNAAAWNALGEAARLQREQEASTDD